ncbi:hypothetical protein J6590_076224 [Homalodisca vitripennis]|nr:hypothetical protein J6590_076224 [Homalodisca vitripennis]
MRLHKSGAPTQLRGIQLLVANMRTIHCSLRSGRDASAMSLRRIVSGKRHKDAHKSSMPCRFGFLPQPPLHSRFPEYLNKGVPNHQDTLRQTTTDKCVRVQMNPFSRCTTAPKTHFVLS